MNPPCTGRPKLRDLSCGESAKADYYWAPADLVILSGLLARVHKLQVLDAVAEGLDAEAALLRCTQPQPTVIISLVAAVTLQEDAAFLARLKSATSAQILVLGDLPSFLPLLTFSLIPAADGLIRDFTDPGLVRELDSGPEEGSRIWWRASASGQSQGWDQVPEAECPARLRDAEVRQFEVGVPRHDLFPLKHYRLPFTRSSGVATVLTASGCPYACRFCASNRLPFRVRPIPEVLDELRYLKALGVEEFYLRDLTFGPNRSRARELAEAIVKADLGLVWSAECRADVLTDEILELMAAGGCRVILVGIETGDPELARRLGKPSGPALAPRVLAKARKTGIRTCGHFILGTPGETEAQTRATIELARRLPMDYASFNLYAPRPGSVMWRELVDAGVIRGDDTSGQDVSLKAGGIAGMESGALKRLFRDAVLSFYFRPAQMVRLARVTPWRVLLRQGLSVIRLLTEMD